MTLNHNSFRVMNLSKKKFFWEKLSKKLEEFKALPASQMRKISSEYINKMYLLEKVKILPSQNKNVGKKGLIFPLDFYAWDDEWVKISEAEVKRKAAARAAAKQAVDNRPEGA